ncbi:pantetheine-phosphate adenylyltransferase [[Clostridium] colinum]|uniref:pantetheine-phosphate adenylyltransferase n=1 Tax=[Clostridium] colinum TaxID=36835 RepID=UPI002023D824|nr:pantetheine-phosphate adenylyltransferase [[Clostridium] colinum]
MNAVYPGSFDPPTNGHLDIITRASKLTDTLIVAVLNNHSKNPMFSTQEKIEMLKELTKNIPNVRVESFSGLLVDFCKKMDCKIVIRGLRALTDFEYEFQIALTNKTMNKEIETLFMPTDTQNLWLSSSVVKEIAIFGGQYDDMVPKIVKDKLEEKVNKGEY